MVASSDTNPLFALWGKFDSISMTYHPLPCHMLDVAAVAGVLWDVALHQATRLRLASAFGLSENATGAWICLFAALHDLGKASPAFQAKDAGARDRLEAVGLSIPNAPGDTPHGSVTASELPSLLVRLWGLDRDLADIVSAAVGGHHGRFPQPPPPPRFEWPLNSLGGPPWEKMRERMVAAIGDAIGIPADQPTGIGTSTAILLAGLVSVADWIGSIRGHFPYLSAGGTSSSSPSLGAYWTQARESALQAIHQLTWDAWQPPSTLLPLSGLFPEIQTPRPVQHAVEELLPLLSTPSLVIVEAPMGEGKTEAALLLADHLNSVSGGRGVYFALPTQATSNQMLGRVRSYLERRFPESIVNLLLLHGHSSLNEDFRMLRDRANLLEPASIYTEHEGDGAIIAADWFSQSKRGLLAPFGVGTVDQALMGVLRVKHGSVRLFGLAGKTVIVDEAHAYDVYTSSLLERLLEWLSALGTSVVVLSATLPQVKRNALVAAFQQGLGQTPGAAAHQAYPRITWVDGAGRSGAIHATPAPELRRVIGFEAMEGTADVIAAALSHALSGGGCAAVICNTVARAQEIYEALIPYFPGEADDGFPVLDMLHARFPYDERQVREQRVLSRFGRPLNNPKGHTRPNRAVLVSTQVIEQSLDIDFDLMASDFAPVDLLLQRAGRLWRHERGVRPVPGPQLWVMGGTGSPDEVPVFPEGTSFVYDPHVLLRSWLALNGRFQLSLPTDLEPLIESVYGHAEEPQGLSDTLGEHWRTTSLLLDRRLNVATGEAARRRLGPPYSEGELWTLTSDIYEEDSPDLHPELQALTRLTEPSVQVIPLYGSPDKPLIDPGGHAVGPLNRPPSAADIEALMRRSFSVASSRLVFALRDQPIPGWQRSTLLRHHRVLWLQDDHTWQSDPSVRMAADLGLVVPRTGGGRSGE